MPTGILLPKYLNIMLKIATHDSATGEKGCGIISFLITPFSKTQSKTLKEQHDAGCRLFDIRIKKYGNEWKCAHGLWKSKRGAWELFEEMNSFPERVGVSITFEGHGTMNEEFLDFVHKIKETFKHIIYGGIAVKYGDESNGFNVKYTYLESAEPDFSFFNNKQAFLPLDGRSWHTYLPIPWLWDKLYMRPHQFDDEVFKYVDFL